MRGTTRLCDVEKRTVLNILKLAGENCERLLIERIRNVKVQDSLELDEVWTYVGCHQKRLTPGRVERGMVGDAYTFICLERSTKLVVAWHLGKCDRTNTEDFVPRSGGLLRQADSTSVPMASSRTRRLSMPDCMTAPITPLWSRCFRPSRRSCLKVIGPQHSYRWGRMRSVAIPI